MKFNKFLFCSICAIGLAIAPSRSDAQSIASGVLGGSSGVPNVPSIIATATVTNLPLNQGTSIDLRANRNVAIDLSFNGSSAATNATVIATFAPSLDGTTWDASKTFSLAVTGTGTTTARGSTNYDSAGYPFVVPILVTNGIAVTVSNVVVRYGTKNGS